MSRILRHSRQLRRFCTYQMFDNGVVATAGWKAHMIGTNNYGLFKDDLSLGLAGPEGEHLFEGILTHCYGNKKPEVQEVMRGLQCAGASCRVRYVDETIYTFKGKQIVILGCGFDTRAWRLPNLAQTAVFELDLEELFTLKEKRLNGLPPVADLRQISVDFRDKTWDKQLKRYGFNVNKPSLFILEDVLMFLDEDTVDDVFEKISTLTSPGSQMVGNFSHEIAFKINISTEIHKTQEFLSLYHAQYQSYTNTKSFRSNLKQLGWDNVKCLDNNILFLDYLGEGGKKLLIEYRKAHKSKVLTNLLKIFIAKFRGKIREAGAINQVFFAEKFE